MRAAPIVLHCICMHLYSLLYSLQTADTALLVILFQFLCAAAYSGTDRNIPIHAVTTVCIVHSEELRRRECFVGTYKVLRPIQLRFLSFHRLLSCVRAVFGFHMSSSSSYNTIYFCVVINFRAILRQGMKTVFVNRPLKIFMNFMNLISSFNYLFPPKLELVELYLFGSKKLVNPSQTVVL